MPAISAVDSGIFVPDLCEDLQACARPGVAIECRAESHDVSLTAAVPLGLIINELVTNSLKYAFPGQRPGLVRVLFVREGDRYRLLVEDNGVGMSGDVKGNETRVAFAARVLARAKREHRYESTCRAPQRPVTVRSAAGGAPGRGRGRFGL